METRYLLHTFIVGFIFAMNTSVITAEKEEGRWLATGIFCVGGEAPEKAREIAEKYKRQEKFNLVEYAPGCVYLSEVVDMPKGLDLYDLDHIVARVVFGPQFLGCKKCAALFITGTVVPPDLLKELSETTEKIIHEELGD